MGKGQNVKNHFVKSLKKNIESLEVDWLIRTSKVFFLIDQNVERSERRKEHRKSNLSDFQILTTYGVSTYGILASILNLKKSFLTCLNLT